MLTRKNTIALLLAALAAPAALAQADAVWVGGEIGWATRQIQGNRTRAEVLAELKQFRANPVLADGSTYVGGERGYVEHRHSYTIRDGAMVHTPPFAATMGINAASPYERVERRPGREPWEVMPY
jgi:hypothetical protein